MVHDPMVLILDEPTTGLDPQTRISVWNLVNDLRDKTWMTVFLTTHYMEEAEKATDVVIMDKGRIIARGTPTELKNRYSGDYLLLNGPRNEAMETVLAASGLPYRYNEDAQCYRVRVSTAAEIIAFLQEHKDLVTDFEVKKGDMDDVFLNVTGMNKKESDSL